MARTYRLSGERAGPQWLLTGGIGKLSKAGLTRPRQKRNHFNAETAKYNCFERSVIILVAERTARIIVLVDFASHIMILFGS